MKEAPERELLREIIDRCEHEMYVKGDWAFPEDIHWLITRAEIHEEIAEL